MVSSEVSGCFKLPCVEGGTEFSKSQAGQSLGLEYRHAAIDKVPFPTVDLALSHLSP